MLAPAARAVLSTSRNVSARRPIMTLNTVKYTATATAQGAGRNGTVASNGLQLSLATPKELGGSGNGENPEQLFAMGYSACLLGAIQAVARQQGHKAAADNAVVHATVKLGEPHGAKGFGLAVDIKVEGVDEELLKAGHAFCPYSRALSQGVEVTVSTA